MSGIFNLEIKQFEKEENIMKKLLTLLLIATCFAALVPLKSIHAAGYKNNTKIKLYYIGYTGNTGTRFFINIEGSADGTPPACASQPYRFVGDYSTEHGKMIYSVLLAAQLSGKTVSISGTDECSIWGNTESIAWVVLND